MTISHKSAGYFWPIKKLTSELLGKKVFLFNEQIVTKEPHTKSSFNWHQDSGYIDFEHKPYLSTWLALDDINELNGPLSLIPTKLEAVSYTHLTLPTKA